MRCFSPPEMFFTARIFVRRPSGNLRLSLRTSQSAPLECSTQCQVSTQDFILQAREPGAVDYTRFCFYECQPSGPVGGECVPLSIKTLEKVYGAHDMDEITRASAPALRPKRPFKLGRKTQDASRDAVMKDPAPYGDR